MREFPHHKRTAEAWVALAELAFHGVPANLDAARKNLSKAAESGPNDAARERADYLVIWIEDAAPGTDAGRVIGAANQFLGEPGVAAGFGCPDEVGGKLITGNRISRMRRRSSKSWCRRIREPASPRKPSSSPRNLRCKAWALEPSTARSSCSMKWSREWGTQMGCAERAGRH